MYSLQQLLSLMMNIIFCGTKIMFFCSLLHWRTLISIVIALWRFLRRLILFSNIVFYPSFNFMVHSPQYKYLLNITLLNSIKFFALLWISLKVSSKAYLLSVLFCKNRKEKNIDALQLLLYSQPRWSTHVSCFQKKVEVQKLFKNNS